ncbi:MULTISPECIES: helix-turn-helix domain-containing protein [unclassified Nocardioides]|uniref:helix-turn-helix domain-containing protein n=1 Tax=unclassified Nocardioides TaxID=2615069 RepID=UPI000AC2F218|nr:MULTISPECIES: helix-turn-helix transcriptional regulator [unclassified Nocardioides]
MTDRTDMTDMTETAERPLPAAGHQVEVRRNAALSVGIGGFAGLMTVAFAARAFTGGTALDWLAFGILALVTGIHLASLSDSRAPLLVADEHGVRVREGAIWRGIAWQDIDCLEHLPRHGLFRDGHLLVDGYDDRQLVVPLTLATRLVGASAVSLSDVLADLADDRADVVEVVSGVDEEPSRRASVPSLSDLYGDEDGTEPAPERRGIAARVAAGLSGVVPGGRSAETDESDETEVDGIDRVEDTLVVPAEDLTPAAADVDELRSRLARIRESSGDTGTIPAVTDTHTDTHTDTESTDEIVLDELGEASTDEIAVVDADIHDQDDEPPAPGRPTVLSARVERPATIRAQAVVETEPAAVEDNVTVVLDDLAVRPAVDPVIGPEIAAARERLRLTIDQVSDRTRIRPHVVEAIEVDDFGPCGGDFYARGHLRTLARILGIDAAPLVASYDERYAHEPVDPRRVFQSELATGTGGAIRSTRGGRNWSVMIAAVMGAVLVWSVARLVMDGPAPVADAPVLNQSGGVTGTAQVKGDPVKLTLTAAGGGATLNVRDGGGRIVFEGNLAFGQTSELRVVPPIRIYSTDGSVTYAVGGAKAKALGETGAEASKTVIAPR